MRVKRTHDTVPQSKSRPFYGFQILVNHTKATTTASTVGQTDQLKKPAIIDDHTADFPVLFGHAGGKAQEFPHVTFPDPTWASRSHLPATPNRSDSSLYWSLK